MKNPLSVGSAMKTGVCPWLLGLVWAVTTAQSETFSRGRRSGALPVLGGGEEGQAGGRISQADLSRTGVGMSEE